jgi:hypothetical protein
LNRPEEFVVAFPVIVPATMQLFGVCTAMVSATFMVAEIGCPCWSTTCQVTVLSHPTAGCWLASVQLIAAEEEVLTKLNAEGTWTKKLTLLLVTLLVVTVTAWLPAVAFEAI